MTYKILYIEDLPADSIKDSLERCGFEAITNDTNDFDSALFEAGKDIDVYLMGFRLIANRGKADAPTFALILRTFRDNHRNKPIILISNDKNLPAFENDFTSQDLFDFAVDKKSLRQEVVKYSDRIKSLIDSYKKIRAESFDIARVLGTDNIDMLDYRLIDKLNTTKGKDNTYAPCRIIYYSIVRSIGLLVGEDILAARLGVDLSSPDFEKFLCKTSNCKYSGILSSSYDRWWFHEIIEHWNDVSGNKSLRHMNAKERVEIINNVYHLNLAPARPLEHATSTYFRIICVITKQPLDPNEGYVYAKKELEVWQEQEYISFFAALEHPEEKKYLSPTDKKDILEF